MNIKEIRAKYPQYNDMSDDDLARALHAKYYSDMDFGDFTVKAGIAPSGSSGPPRRYSAKRDGFSFGEMAGNIPASAAQYGKDIWQAVRHPFQTISALGEVGAGAIQMAIPGKQPYEESARQVGGFYKDRYGGKDAFLNTLETDPVGVLSDVSGLLTGAGSAAPKTLGTLRKVGAAIDPLNVVTKPVRAATKAVIPKKLPESLTMGSAKFGTTYTPAERRAMARTMLDNQILPNQSGYDKLVALQETVGKKIDHLIDRATRTGKKVPLSALSQGPSGVILPDLLKRSSGPTLTSADDLKAIFKVVDDYTQEMTRRGVTELSAKDLQDFKTNAYKQINWSKLNDPSRLPPAKEETIRAMAGNARKEIERISPDIADVNRQYGSFAELREPLSRAVNRIDNRDLIGVGVPLKTAAGAAVGGGGGALLGNAFGLLDAPVPKARLAQMLEALRVNPVLSRDAAFMAQLRQLSAEAGATTGLLQNDGPYENQRSGGLLGY